MEDNEEPCCSGYEIWELLPDFDSKTKSEWISCCIREHVKGDKKPKMTAAQCIAAASAKFGRDSDDEGFYSAELDEYIYFTDTDSPDGRPPKAWWDDCVATIKKKNPGYTEEQIRGTCGMIYFTRGVRTKIGGKDSMYSAEIGELVDSDITDPGQVNRIQQLLANWSQMYQIPFVKMYINVQKNEIRVRFKDNRAANEFLDAGFVNKKLTRAAVRVGISGNELVIKLPGI